MRMLPSALKAATKPRRVANILIVALSASLAVASVSDARKAAHNAVHAEVRELLHHNTRQSGTCRRRQPECVSEQSDNPIYEVYPNYISGSINGTTMIIPIPLETARQAIPKEYGILENAWREWLPDFPAGMYPMMALALHDHDLHFPAYNITTTDFTRAALEFPFLDVLGDGFSSFRWAAYMLITAGSPAVKGSEGFGVTVTPAAFDPPCNPYKSSDAAPGLATIGAWASDGTANNGDPAPWLTAAKSAFFETQPSPDEIPYPLEFIRNITNQPAFATTATCDNYHRLYNTTLTSNPETAPVPVKGTVMAKLEPFDDGAGPVTWSGVYGWRFATAFLEPPMPADCKALKGYSGTGPGDSAILGGH